MTSTPRSRFLLTLFRELFNIFIPSSGADPLLARAHRLIQAEPAQSKNILVLVPISLGIVLGILIRYIVSQVLMSILILETVVAEKQANTSEIGDNKPAPSSRRVFRAIALLYHKGGLRLLLNGIGSSCSYLAMRYSVATLLSALLPGPAARTVASVLLAETHFLWTARSILPRDQMRFVSTARDRVRWKALVLPTLVYAATETAILHVPAVFDSDPASPQEAQVTIAGLSHVVRSDILISGLMLAAQLVLLLPSTIVLTLVQVSLLPANCETLVFPAQQPHRGTRVGEIFSGVGRVPLSVQQAIHLIGARWVLYCLELHSKMCLCLVMVTAMVHAVVYTMI